MTEDEVVALMESSRNDQDWDANADRVKAVCDGYPSFWYSAIILGGVLKRAKARWGDTSPDITVTVLK